MGRELDGDLVLLVDDHRLLTTALSGLLSERGAHVRTVGPEDVVDVAGTCHRPVVLLDLDLGRSPDGSPCRGEDLVAPLVRAGARVCVLTASEQAWRWGLCLALGAADVVAKTEDLDALIRSVAQLAAGGSSLSRERSAQLLQEAHEHRCRVDRELAPFRLLTPRESEVLRELCRGLTVAEIAAQAVLSEWTVRTQVKSLLGKLGVRTQLAAVAMARSSGWLDPSTTSVDGWPPMPVPGRSPAWRPADFTGP